MNMKMKGVGGARDDHVLTCVGSVRQQRLQSPLPLIHIATAAGELTTKKFKVFIKEVTVT